MDLSIWGAAVWRPQLDGRPHRAPSERCNSQRQLLLGVRAASESYCDTLHAAGTERALGGNRFGAESFHKVGGAGGPVRSQNISHGAHKFNKLPVSICLVQI